MHLLLVLFKNTLVSESLITAATFQFRSKHMSLLMFSKVLFSCVAFLANSALVPLLCLPSLTDCAAAGLRDDVLCLPRPVVRVITGHLVLGGQHGLLGLGHGLRLLRLRLRVPGVTHVTGQDGHGGL